MGQSFLTHDEKPSSTGSPSPDLLQFNNNGGPKFFGSLSSVKETSVDSASTRSHPLESVGDSSEDGHNFSPRSRSPRSAVDDSEVYCSLVPTPILPGNVSRLRKKFMEGGSALSSRRFPSGGPIGGSGGVGGGGRDSYSDLDCRYFSKDAVISRSGTPLSRHRLNRHSLHVFSPCPNVRFIQHGQKSRTLPPPTPTYEEKLVGIRSDNDLSVCFRKMGFGTGDNMGSFASETPLLNRRRPRTRPYVPPPRSVIIKAGYLPKLQKVGRAPTGKSRNSNSRKEHDSSEEEEDYAEVAPLLSRTSVPTSRTKKEDSILLSSSLPSSSSHHSQTKPKGLSVEQRRSIKQNVASQEDHTSISKESRSEKTALMKDAGVNTSAEVLVLPKGTKTSVLLKSGVIDEVDGIKSLKNRRRKRKRLHRRVGRAFRRVMFGFLEFF